MGRVRGIPGQDRFIYFTWELNLARSHTSIGAKFALGVYGTKTTIAGP